MTSKTLSPSCARLHVAVCVLCRSLPWPWCRSTLPINTNTTTIATRNQKARSMNKQIKLRVKLHERMICLFCLLFASHSDRSMRNPVHPSQRAEALIQELKEQGWDDVPSKVLLHSSALSCRFSLSSHFLVLCAGINIFFFNSFTRQLCRHDDVWSRLLSLPKLRCRQCGLACTTEWCWA